MGVRGCRGGPGTIVRNAVLVMHGTGGTGTQFIRAEFAGELFRAGGVLDASRYFIIIPDGIGHGGSQPRLATDCHRCHPQRLLFAVNSADDLVNPPELGILEREIKRVPKGRAVVVPMSTETRGHGTHTIAAVWQKYLQELLSESH